MSLPILFLSLVLASAALALLALVRQRPATFVVAASQTMLLRSLLRFSQEGRPDTLAYTPQWVFAPGILLIAAQVMFLAVAMLGVCVALPGRHARLDPHTLPPLPRWSLWVLAAYFVLVAVSQRSIFAVEYASDEQQIFSTPIGGVQTIMASALLYEVCRRVWIRQWSVIRGLMVVTGVFFVTDFLRGATGIATGYILVAALLMWQSGQGRLRVALRVTVLLAAVSGLAMVVRMTRGDVHREGFSAIENAVENLTTVEGGGQQMDEAASGPQFAAHVLDCIAVYESGHSREWRSLSDPVIFTFEPAFLTGPLGIERPLSAPWELGLYFIHLGGISVFGEAYWNGGFLGVLVIVGSILTLCYFCDTRYRSSFTWLIILLNFGPVLLAGVNYGFSYEFRAVVNALIQLAVYRIMFPRPAALMASAVPLRARGVPALTGQTSDPTI